ncbi:MAG: hypothetical protein KJO07_09920 [Deltaproteobacteria bacterium]|jgi:hypothetical protein|nr:hypothetical protein [Deltaproteobacteria bacterium]
MSTAKTISAALLALFAGACTGAEPMGPPDADELADLGVQAVPAYAAQLATTITMCETLADGECNPEVEDSSFTIDLKAAIDVSGERAVVLPCGIAIIGEKKTHIIDSAHAPSGDAQTRLTGSDLDLRLAFLFGAEPDDPFDLDASLSAAQVDHDGDDRPGMTFNTPGPGNLQFAARMIIDVTGIDATADADVPDASAVSLDYAVLGDTIPLVNAKKKVDQYLEDNKQAGQETSATLLVVDSATCANVDQVLP